MIETICFELGDTLAAEESVIHDSLGTVITADFVVGVFEVLETFR